MIIMFIRHAEAKGDKLTSLGKKQAKLLASQNEDFKFNKIYCSPLGRCKDTMKIYNKKHHLLCEIDDRLRERECLKVKPKTKDEQKWYDNYMNPKFSNLTPEGCKDFLNRIYEFLGERIFEHYQKDENIIIISHSGTFYAIMAYLNKEKKGDIAWYKVGNASKVYFEIK